MQPSTTQLPLRSRRTTAQVAGGAVAIGLAGAILLRAGLGLDPWNVLASGIAQIVGAPFTVGYAIVALGTVGAVHAVAPGRDRILDAAVMVVATIAVAVALSVIPEPAVRDIEIKCAMLVTGVLVGGLGLASILGATGRRVPTEQLWESLAARTGLTPFQSQATVQGLAGVVGFALGGLVNFGTVFAVLTTGAIVRLATTYLTIPRSAIAEEATAAARGRASTTVSAGATIARVEQSAIPTA